MSAVSARHLAIFDSFNFKGVVSIHDMMQDALAHSGETFEDAWEVRQGYPWNY